MNFCVAAAGLAFGLTAVLAAPQAFASQGPPIRAVLDLRIDYFAGGLSGPPIFPESSLTGAVQFYVADPLNIANVTPFLMNGPPIDIATVGIGEHFTTRFINGPPIDMERFAFSFSGFAAGFAAQAFALDADVPLEMSGPPILPVGAFSVQGPPIRTSGRIFAYDAPVQVGVWTATLSEEGVPEPAAWTMMLMGFGGLGAVLRRRLGQVPLTA